MVNQQMTWVKLIVTHVIIESLQSETNSLTSRYIRYRSTLGNRKYASKIFFGFWLFCTWIYVLALFLLEPDTYWALLGLIAALFDVLLLVLIVICWKLTPPMQDTFFIRRQATLSLLLLRPSPSLQFPVECSHIFVSSLPWLALLPSHL